MSVPTVRATFGNFSGPITTSATTAMTSNSEKAMSNIVDYCCLDFSVTSPSMVRFAASSSCGLDCSSRMASLNPFTAPPRSLPTLRSFLVPNTTSTTTNTINQCQILKDPMSLSLDPGQRSAAAEYVNVQVEHLLPAALAGIDHGAKTIQPLLGRQFRRQQQHAPKKRLM